jgi:peptidyl-prolyl cis-trans isomerase B (cyclophilin B)
MKRYQLAGTATILALALSAGGCASTAERGGKTETVVVLHTNQGDIALRFFPESAPEHVKNFISHSRSGYYTGTTFHRVIPGFVIQGGDPNSKDDDPSNDGMGGYSYKGPDTTLPAEFNERKHVRGTLSMARAQDPNSAGSQFFVCQADTPFLDNKYTVFGEVIDGIEVVDRIVNVERDGRDRPLENQTIEGVTVAEWPVSTIEASKLAMWAAEGEKAGGEKKASGPGLLFRPPHLF